MLVVNDGNDVRALKEASSLADHGHLVTLIGRRAGLHEVRYEQRDSVTIKIVPQIIDPLDLIRVVKAVPNLSAQDRLYASWTSFLYRCAGIRFVNGEPSRLYDKVPLKQKILLGWQKREAEHAYGMNKADGVQPDFFAKTQLSLAKLAYRLGAAGAGLTAKIDQETRNFPVRVYNLTRRLLPQSIANRIHARVVAHAQNMRPKTNYFLYYLESAAATYDEKPNFIHAHDLYNLQTAIKTAQVCGAKTVYDAHEFETHRNHKMSATLKTIVESQERKYIKKADGVITVSKSIARELSQMYNLENVQIIYNSPITAVQGKRRSSVTIRKDLKLDKSTPLALFVGKVYDIHSHDHRVDHIIQAMAHTPDMHLALLSITTPKSVQQIRHWAERYFVEDRVHLVDPVPYEKLVDYIRTADLGVYAMPARCMNIEYSMPNKLFEYALAGMPLAASNLTDALDFLNELEIGEVFDPNDIRQIAKTMMSVYASKKTYKMNSHRLKLAREKYGWEAQGQALIALYDKIAKQ